MSMRLVRRAHSPFNTLSAFGLLGEGEGEGGGTAGGNESAGKSDSGYTAPATQDELDRIISERLTRERARFSDYDELKRRAADSDKAAEAAKSDHEKAVDAARQEGERSAIERTQRLLIAAEARALAAAARFRTPTDAVALLDLSSVKVSESGEVDSDALRDSLKALAAAKPYLITDDKATKPKPDPTQGAGKGEAVTGVNAGRDMYAASRGKAVTTK